MFAASTLTVGGVKAALYPARTNPFTELVVTIGSASQNKSVMEAFQMTGAQWRPWEAASEPLGRS